MIIKYILKRLVQVIPTIFGIITLIFFSIHLIPGDPVDIMLGENALPIAKMELKKNLNLDKPIIEQYLIYLKNIIFLNAGNSIFSHQPVFKEILARFPATLQLTILSIIIAIIIALPLGIISAVKKDSFIDFFSRILSLSGISIPNFWLGPMLIILFSIWLNLLPVSGKDNFLSYILPALTLGSHLA
ncbi:MAG TPA: ABC transporter permease, partial [bacterium]|nr:ABC transporter permease [bacterium]